MGTAVPIEAALTTRTENPGVRSGGLASAVVHILGQLPP